MYEDIVTRFDALSVSANQNEEDGGKVPRVIPLEPPIVRCALQKIQIYEEESDEEEAVAYDRFAQCRVGQHPRADADGFRLKVDIPMFNGFEYRRFSRLVIGRGSVLRVQGGP
ncbi:hypothetical protein CRG98_025267 [Punica granatum]|uniref:Uncharacterized protein n=1 Tax=Punica granatum TaxID=22663 RepID=A0A2I0JDK6_PUNGR|nr:hypothetical protein CRG98_025267 [Punica granatum]